VIDCDFELVTKKTSVHALVGEKFFPHPFLRNFVTPPFFQPKSLLEWYNTARLHLANIPDVGTVPSVIRR